MGRKTFESIGKPLPNRANVVITRDPNFKPDGVIVINDPMMAFDLALEAEEDLKDDLGEESFEMIIIGGGEMYNFFLPYAHKLYLSEVDYNGPADAYFPMIDHKEWEVESTSKFSEFTFKILTKI